MRKCDCYGDSQWRSPNGFVALVTSLGAPSQQERAGSAGARPGQCQSHGGGRGEPSLQSGKQRPGPGDDS